MPTKESFDIDGLMVFRSDLTAVDQDGNTVASVATPDKYVPSLKEPLSGEQIGRYTNTISYWREHSTYVPLKGEVIIYSDGGSITEGGTTVYIPKIKIGDGTTTVVNLPFTDSDTQGGIAGTLDTTNTSAQTPSSSESLSGNVNLHKVAKTGDYGDLLNKPTIPTVNDAVLTIQKNGTTVDTFSANASQNKTINITVPTTASDVGALPSSTKYGSSISMTVNQTTFVVTAQLKDQDGNNLGGAQTIDLPLESVVVSGSYNAQTKKVVLTLQNGSTIEFSVADLVAGLQSEITAQNPLSADLIVDGTTNKVFTLTMKTKLDGIEAGAEVNVQSDWNQSDNTKDDYIKNKPNLATVATSGDYDDLTNKPTIPAAQIQSDWNQSDNTQKDYIKNKPSIPSSTSDLTNDSGFITINDVPKEVFVCNYNSSNNTMDKTPQEIYDAKTAGNTVVCFSGNSVYDLNLASHVNNNYVIVFNVIASAHTPNSIQIGYIMYNGSSWSHGITYLQRKLYSSGVEQNIKTVNNESLLGSGNITIHEGDDNVQSDWNQSDNTADDYIKNKPQNIVTDANYVHTDNNYTTTEKNKLAGIESGAEVNVQADWSETDTSSDAYILHKPDLDATLYEPVTYSQLVTKINSSQLVKGKKYRITDYVTTTTQSNTSSAGHAFDLVVTAIDVNKLDCKASALLHSGDTYFSTAQADAFITSADLSKWQIWYDVENNKRRFRWADTNNGKGVIYRMIDEWGNDCPYDFKNILFTIGGYTDVYTFNKFASGDTSNIDHSFKGAVCYGNVIKQSKDRTSQMLNFIVFNNDNDGSLCYSNIFGDACAGNVFGSDCRENIFGENCSGITFGNNCTHNTIGKNCRELTFGSACSSNTFGNNCLSIIFGDSSTPSAGGDLCKNIIVEEGNWYIRLYYTASNNCLQNIYIAQGCSGTSSAYTEISTIARNLSYRTTVGRDSSGNIRIYNEDDPASASQAQANWNETSSSSPSYIQNKPTLTTVTFRHW